MPDTFFFSNNVAVAAEIDLDITWQATSRPENRGTGIPTPDDDQDWGRFTGRFRDGDCWGTGAGRETGFQFKTGKLDASGFFATTGTQENGAWLT